MTFVGFGFGPIQAGLMVQEAYASGAFDRAVIAEVDQVLVDAVRAAGDTVTVNIAGRDGIRVSVLRRCVLLNPRVPADRAALVREAAAAREMATAVPRVDLYGAGGDASVASILAEAAADGAPRIVYTAENDNRAAEALGAAVAARAGGSVPAGLEPLNTVVGKMSGVVSSEADMRRLGLAPLVPGLPRCVLVEEFNRILVSRVTLPGFRRGITVFEEKDDLLPFEEAKLYGHNAVHALLGYLARLRGHQVMSALRADPALLALGRRAFVEESGAALVRRHASLHDPLFTPAGYAAYADDLLVRMTSPWLEDRVERVIRDPLRKLAWNDRFFGTMRIALSQGVEPRLMALGAAAAVEHALQAQAGPGARVTPAAARETLLAGWGPADGPADQADRERCVALTVEAVGEMEEWRH